MIALAVLRCYETLSPGLSNNLKVGQNVKRSQKLQKSNLKGIYIENRQQSMTVYKYLKQAANNDQ